MKGENRKSLKRVGQFLKEKRIERELTQRELADILGYTSPQFISNWERGLAVPPIESLGVIVAELEIRPQTITDLYMETSHQMLRDAFNKIRNRKPPAKSK